ncbi:MAG: hypothetical protein KI790_16690 [Cyclobacteriaceae bacterium]|nr:hypothetical protein [Cyclobacteriaceae bacterium HetDA_MAG_MS6]
MVKYFSAIVVSIWISCTAMGQHLLDQSLEDYQERIVLYAAKPIYLAGETCQVKVHALQQDSSFGKAMSKFAYVELINAQKEVVDRSIFLLQGGQGFGRLKLPATLNSGRYMLRAYTSWMRNFSAKLFGYTSIMVINPFRPDGGHDRGVERVTESPYSGSDQQKILLETDQEIYGRRQSISISASVQEEVIGDLSLAVFKVPDFYTMNQACPLGEYSGDDIQTIGADYEYMPEIRGHLIKIKATANGAPASGITVFTAIPGDSPDLFVGDTDVNGLVTCELGQLRDIEKIHLKTPNPDVNLELVSAYVPLDAAPHLPAFRISRQWQSFIEEASLNLQIASQYGKAHLPVKKSSASLPFYGIPQNSYLLDDYTRFPTVEESFFEYVKGVQVRKQGENYTFKVVNPAGNQEGVGGPLVMVDGIPVFREKTILETPSSLFRKIDVIYSPFYLGRKRFGGVVSLYTYQNRPSSTRVDLGENYSYPELQFSEVNALKTHTKSAAEGPEADFRNTLCWEPNVRPDENRKIHLSCYTSDAVGTYMVLVRGVNKLGQMIYGHRVLQVKEVAK